MPSPEEMIDELREAIAEPLSIIADPWAGRFLGAAVEDFENLAIGLACVHLFERADEEGYARNLQLCGFARQHFVRRMAAAEEVDDVYSAASRAQGDLAAFIAGDDLLVLDIVSHTPTERLGGEYEDDYWYRRILHHLMIRTERTGDTELILLLDRFENAREGAEQSRSALCVAFRDGDEEGFWSTFRSLHDEVEGQRASPPPTDDPWPEVYGRLWLEGIVWLALASQRWGWSSPEIDYPLCPSWGHRRTSPPAGENIFATLPVRE